MLGFGNRSDSDIQTSLKKACSSDEVAPKRKHVRACILYTWDHKSSREFWHVLKLLPIQSDEVQLFKALIVIHKVLQEGHPSCLIGGYKNISWIESIGRFSASSGLKGYGPLIKEYVFYVIQKLHFHHDHRGFNGMFEYEEYVSLRAVSDPNEGFESILDLLSLQDSLDGVQRVIFSSVQRNRDSECIISALVPLIAESYGIYKFLISMLRAMYRSSQSDDVIAPLKDKFDVQHRRLYDFYADCSTIKYLSTLVSIPKIPPTPPSLMVDSNEPNTESSILDNGLKEKDQRESTPVNRISVQPTGVVVDTYSKQQEQFEEQQRLAEERKRSELLQQQMMQHEQAQYWEEQQRQQALSQELARQQLISDQSQRQAQGKLAQLEQDLLALGGQHERDQLILEQYDQRVKALENEIGLISQTSEEQVTAKSQQCSYLQEQVTYWRNKYESLAKLYSQLRQEHLGLLNKFKTAQQKAASAQESVEKREKLEKEMKAKNIELADLIKERDRARLNLERLKGNDSEQLLVLESKIRDLEDQLKAVNETNAKNLQAIFSRHQKELEDVRQNRSSEDQNGDPQLELQIMQQAMEDTMQELAEQQKEAQIHVLQRMRSLFDTLLKLSIDRVHGFAFELESPGFIGSRNITAEYVGTMLEKASHLSTQFATSMTDYIGDEMQGESETVVIRSLMEFTNSIEDVFSSVKGMLNDRKDDVQDVLVEGSKDLANMIELFFEALFSENLEPLQPEDKTDKVINGNINVQEIIQSLMEIVEVFRDPVLGSGTSTQELDSLLDRELANTQSAIEDAAALLADMSSRSKLEIKDGNVLEVNESIISCSSGIINAVRILLQSCIEAQDDIVAKGKGTMSRALFYKKNNRWTEGLISAAKQVAYATGVLIRIADGVLAGRNSSEELIVASNEVAASTAQLVSSSRVKSDYMSKSHQKLEAASKEVNSCCKALVAKVSSLLHTKEFQNSVDYSKLTSHENRTAEMEQQVEILKLEGALSLARKRLGEIRKFSYREDAED